MQSADKMLKNFLDALMPNRAAPVLARVLKAYEGAGKNKYSIDVQVVTAGTLEDTTQIIAEVPISPVWVGKKGRGLYAIPPVDAIVIVGFIGWNSAYPYVAGIWSDEYEAGEFAKDQFVITDGDGMKISIDAAGKKIVLDTGKGSVVTLEEEKITADNGKFQVGLNGDKASLKNTSKSLFTVIDNIIKHVSGMKTVGSPAQHIVSPDDIVNFTTDGQDLAALLEA